MNSSLAKTAITGALFGVLLIATYLVYAPGLQGPFLFDDAVNLPRTAVTSLDWDEIRNHIFWDAKLGGFSRSLVNFSFALTQFVSGFDPHTFKYQNTLLHLVNGTLVFWLAYLLLGYRSQERQRAAMLALAIAAIWLLHPLQLTAVLYAVQRLVLLSSLFVLLALIVFVKGRIWSFHRPVAAFLTTACGVALFGALGVLSKENAALLPLYLLAIELFFFRLEATNRTQKSLLYTLLILFVALPLLIGLAYGIGHGDAFLSAYKNRPFTLPERLLSELHALALYLKLFFVPVPAGMSLFHDNFPIQRHLDLATTALAVTYSLLIGLAFVLRKSHAGIGFGILWFFISHAMESTVFALELVFEHRNYLAIMGLAFVLVLGAERLLATPKLVRVAPLLMLGLVALLAFNTGARAFVWGNGELLLRTQYQQRPDSFRILSGLFGLELRRGNLEQARRYILEAERLDPDSPVLAVNKLRTYCSEESFPSGLERDAQQRIERKPRASGLFGSLNSLTTSYLARQCQGVGYKVVYDLVHAYANTDVIPSSRIRLLTLILQGRLLVDQKRWTEAESIYSRALDLAESDPGAYVNLTVNELARPFLESGNINGLARLLQKVAKPPPEDTE